MLLAFVWGTGAWAYSGTGTEGDPYVISGANANTNWTDLKTVMDLGGYIRLDANCTAPSTFNSNDHLLQVGSSKTVSLNLNGHTIDRGLEGADAVSSGYVIRNVGNLTINGNGKIKGGNNTGSGGGIYNENGTLTINGCSIENNHANYGGGIYIYYGTVNINGGSITNNTTTSGGGGIYHYNSNDYVRLRISGKVTITGNTKGGNPNNVSLNSSGSDVKKIFISGALDNQTRIGVTVTPQKNFTSGLSSNGTTSNFIADVSSYAIVLSNDEARVVDHTTDKQSDKTIVYNLPLHPAGTNVTLMGNGSSTNPYKIGSPEEWDAFATIVNDGFTYAYGELTADITFIGNHIQPGEDGDYSFYHKSYSAQKQYCGTFDGKGHTITLNQQVTGGSTGEKSNWGGLFWHTTTSGNYTATIKNLKVAGRILSTNNGGSIIQNVQSTTTIVNCQSSVIFESAVSPGGLVGHEHASTNLTIKNSLFDGVFNNTTTNDGGGGFVGRQFGRAVINNSYSIPKSISSNYNSFYSISRPEGNSYVVPTISNCYYLFPSTYTNTVNSQGTNASSLSAEQICEGLNTNATGTPWVVHNDTVYLATFAKYVDIEGWTYGESSKTPTFVGRKGDAAVTLKYKVQGASDATYATYTPGTTVLNVGNYTLKASVAAVTDGNGEKWNAWESTMDFTVSAAAGAISAAPTAASLTYNGDEQALLATNGEATGTFYYREGTSGEWSTTPPTKRLATTYHVYYYISPDGNHTADNLGSSSSPLGPVDVTIEPKAVTVSGITASNKTYDGNTTATLAYTNATFAGKVGSDILSVSATGQFASKDVGTGKTVTISTLVLAGASAGNYTIESSSQSTTTANITKAPLTITGITASNKTYDGSTTATVNGTGAIIDGLISGDDLTCTYTGAFDNANVGTVKVVTVNAYISGGASAGNYQVASCNSPTADIAPKALTVTANPKTITYGDAPANAGVTYSGFVTDEDENTVGVLSGTLAYTYSYAQYGDVGSYTITPSGLTSSNYAITFTPGTLTVEPKEVGLEWSTTTTFEYDGEEHAPTATATDLINGDEVGVTVTGAQTDACEEGYVANATALTGDKSGNYKLPTDVSQNFIINRKEVGITWGHTLLTYNGSAQAPMAQATGLVGADECNLTVDGGQTAVGAYTATVTGMTGSSKDNYKLPTTGLSTDYEIVNPLSISFAANQTWATWYGDYDYEVPEGTMAYTVSSVNGSTVTVDGITYVPANMGVLIKRETTGTATVANSNVYYEETCDYTSLLKSGDPTPYQDYILYGNEFVLSSVSAIGEHRCYLPGTGAASARRLTIEMGEAPTGISPRTVGETDSGEWYDLQGRRIGKPQGKGLYIHDGKKVVIK